MSAADPRSGATRDRGNLIRHYTSEFSAASIGTCFGHKITAPITPAISEAMKMARVPFLHESIVDRPESAGRLKGMLRKVRRALGIAIVPGGPMPKDIAHPITEPITQIGDHFMRGVTERTGVVAELHQCQFRLRISEDMIAVRINRRVELCRSCVSHMETEIMGRTA